MKPNHIGRLPIGTTITIGYLETGTDDDGYPIQQWTGVLDAPWQDKSVRATASAKGLMGVISKLAKAWSTACPNSKMRSKLAHRTEIETGGMS